MAEKRNRQFDWSKPFIINNKEFPTTVFPVEDDQNNIKQTRVGANAQGEYFTVLNDGKIQPVSLQNYVPEVTAIGSKAKFQKKLMEEARRNLEKDTNDYLTQSNDNTMVLDVPHSTYNNNLEGRAVRGGESYNQWKEEHPNLASWSLLAGAAPFAVAAYPFMAAAGEAAASTALGQAMTSTLSPLAQLMATGKYMPYVNAGLSSIFAAHGLNDIMNGKFTPQTAMDIAPLTQLIKPMYNTLNTEVKLPKLTTDLSKYNMNINDEYSIGLDPRLQGTDEIPLVMRENAVDNYLDFVGSKDYLNRFKKSGLSDDHYNYMYDIADRRLNDGDFPSHVEHPIPGPNGEPTGVTGVSKINPKDKLYGITLSPKYFPFEVDEALNHELSHWATGNVEPYYNINTARADWTGNPEVSKMIDIMKYNESLVPNRTSFDQFSKKLLRDYPEKKLTPAEIKQQYEQLNDIQEMRAEAYAVIQEAQNEGMSIDEYINANLNKSGNGISNIASNQLIRLGRVLNVNDLKKFINSFLSVTTPIGITTSFINSNNSTSK